MCPKRVLFRLPIRKVLLLGNTWQWVAVIMEATFYFRLSFLTIRPIWRCLIIFRSRLPADEVASILPNCQKKPRDSKVVCEIFVSGAKCALQPMCMLRKAYCFPARNRDWIIIGWWTRCPVMLYRIKLLHGICNWSAGDLSILSVSPFGCWVRMTIR